jgi:Fe-S-cluster containining protein
VNNKSGQSVTLLTSITDITPVLKEKSVENIFFKKHLRTFSSSAVDAIVARLSDTISKQIDCTQCGNCCKHLEPGLEDTEIETLAGLKGMTAEDFHERYVRFDGQSQFLQTKPCMFLDGNLCTIYDSRPGACAAYPHLDQPHIKYKRSVWENYAICPIVFNVVEALKTELGFQSAPPFSG